MEAISTRTGIHRSSLSRHLHASRRDKAWCDQYMSDHKEDHLKQFELATANQPMSDHNKQDFCTIHENKGVCTKAAVRKLNIKKRYLEKDTSGESRSVRCQNTCNIRGKMNIFCTDENCTNKNCSNRIPNPSYLAMCRLKGHQRRGRELVVMKKEMIPKGAIVGQYTGVVREDKGDKKTKGNDHKKNRNEYKASLYLFKCEEDGLAPGMFEGRDDKPVAKFFIDASEMGNNTRFISHSCTPNCEYETYINDGKAQVWIRSLKKIQENESLTIDYGDEAWKFFDICYCGSNKCRYPQTH